MNSGDLAPLLGTLGLCFSVVTVIVLKGPVGKALARRIGGEAGEDTVRRLAQAEDRLHEVEELHARVAELEERLDFAERLLAQSRPGASALPQGEDR